MDECSRNQRVETKEANSSDRDGDGKMPSRNALWTWIKLLGLALAVLDLALVTAQSNSPQTCPPASDISPCVCQVKKNGLDILCEATDVQHITKAMSALKGKSPIIFYLKLRHNNLPKLQGFVFLALDIRHLTIHNSSLATIEETSLSSLGKGGTFSCNSLSPHFSLAVFLRGSLLEVPIDDTKFSRQYIPRLSVP
uniref:Uncharacterized protein n=1 Tax=Anopheles atroparvus TaxID=41427 RepID=A0A182J8C1_ANOAO